MKIEFIFILEFDKRGDLHRGLHRPAYEHCNSKAGHAEPVFKISRYKIIIPFETRLMIAGMLNSPKDCKIPTKENASPVK